MITYDDVIGYSAIWPESAVIADFYIGTIPKVHMTTYGDNFAASFE